LPCLRARPRTSSQPTGSPAIPEAMRSGCRGGGCRGRASAARMVASGSAQERPRRAQGRRPPGLAPLASTSAPGRTRGRSARPVDPQRARIPAARGGQAATGVPTATRSRLRTPA